MTNRSSGAAASRCCVDPDQSSEPVRTKSIPNAFVVGVKFVVDIGKLFGISPPA